MENYYTVSEYAEKMGKDPGNIRRMLIKGTLKGEKFGKQWIIPIDIEFPEDRRLKSGDYRNWRKRVMMYSEYPVLMKKLRNMSTDLKKIYGAYLQTVILYGSYARGEQTDESDIDIAIVLKKGNTESMHDSMIDTVVDYELDIAKTLSIVPIDYENYQEWRKVLPFYKNIDKEGIIIWKAA